MAEMPSLQHKVEVLIDPATYGAEPGDITPIETHWSWVILTPTQVLKLKKPLWRPWVDLTTLEAREASCREELRLNRRLTSGVYHDVVPLRLHDDGGMSIDGNGQVVEWLVRMKRLPAERMLNALIGKGEVNADQVTTLGQRLAEFYASQPPQVADGRLYIEHLRTETTQNRRRLIGADIGMPAAEVREILGRCDQLLEESLPAIRARIAAGRIIEGHGDLRPEHVCLVEPIQIFDCLEFDRGMRILDPFDEVNYLGLECAVLGAAWIRTQLLAVLDDVLGGRPSPRLMSFYSVFRATLRARICLAHLDDAQPMEPARWPAEARAYLRVAQDELVRVV